MKKISTTDVRNRITRLNESYACQIRNINPDLIYKEALRGYNISAITKSIRNSANLISSESCNEQSELEKIFDLFEAVSESELGEFEMNTVKNLITETSDRVRKPDELQTLLKRRLTKATTQNGANKLNKDLDNKKAALGKSNPIEADLKKLQGNLSAASSGTKTTNTTTTKKESVENFYNELCDRSSVNIEIDRILKNYDKLSRRFNIDKVFMSIKDSIPDDIDMYCGLFETWSDDEMSTKSKFNVAMETALYLNTKLHLDINRSTIIESVVNYFIFREGVVDDPIKLYDTIYSYLQNNSMVTESELEPFTDTYNKVHDIRPDNYGSVDYIVEESKKTAKSGKNELIEKFMAEAKKSPAKLKELVTKLYSQQPEHIFQAIPNVFTILRYFIVIGATAIHPILGIVTFMTDQFLKLELSRPMAAKMVAKYEKELDKVETKINKTTDEKKKEKLKAYQKTVKEQLQKLRDHEDSLYTDEQNQKREEERWAKDAEKNGNLDGDEWNFDFGLDEAVAMISMIESVVDRPVDKFYHQIEQHIKCLVENDIIDTITSFVLENSDMFSKSRVSDIYKDEVAELKSNGGLVKNYITIDILNQNIARLNSRYKVTEGVDPINRMTALYSLYEALDMLDANNGTPYFLEVSFANTVNIVKTKIQSAFAKMSDKEKQISKTIDVTFVGFTKKVEDMFKSNNREAVIKGSIIPSASKMLKMALAAGLTAWLLHPVVAVIGILGYIGVSKVLQNKERQLVLDEIDTELQMVDKYIQQAEAKDDMVALKNLLTTKKRLQREYTRVKYKIKITTGSSTPDVEKAVGPVRND